MSGYCKATLTPQQKMARFIRRQKWTTLIAAFFLGLLVLCILAAPWLAPHDPYYVDVSIKLNPPSAAHLLGTDNLGRDIFSRLIYGARFSVVIAIVITICEVMIGCFVGLLVGWYGQWIEKLFFWMTNIISAFPSFLLAVAIAGILGQGIGNLMFSIIVIEWIYYAKLTLSLVKVHRFSPHALSAKMMGYSDAYVLYHHVLPFVYKPILTLALMNVGAIVLMISGFSFLGIGVQPDITEWGMMLHDAKNYFRTNVTMMLYPSLAILLTVMSCNAVGEALQDMK